MSSSAPRTDLTLIIGATGFAGGALAKDLRKHGRAVRAMVRPTADPSELIGIGVECVKGDILDPASISSAMQGVDLVYNFASPFRIAKPTREQFWQVNVQGVSNVIDAVREHGVSRFVQCSTVGVHGSVKEIPCNEKSPLNPGDDYQETKLEGEQVFLEAVEQGLPGVLMRPGPMYGVGDTRMLKMFKLIQQGKWFTVGNGEAWFHPTYVEDLVQAFRLSGEHPDAVGETFIFPGHKAISLNELTAAVAKAVGVKTPTRKLPLVPMLLAARACELICGPLGIEPPLYRRRVKFFTNDRNFDGSKARNILGYEPQVPLEEGLKKTVDWYVQQGLLDPPSHYTREQIETLRAEPMLDIVKQDDDKQHQAAAA
jgi:nucleoside-diphosphate-sugar epimerase